MRMTNEQFGRQIYLEAHRLILVRLRDRGQLLIAMLINIIMAVSLSSGFSIFFVHSYSNVFAPPVQDSIRPFYPSPLARYSDFNSNDFPLQQLLFFTSAALGCASCLTAIPIFSGMKAIAKRENTGGISVSAYAIGRMLGDIPFLLTMAMVFCGTWCSFGMPGYPGDWILVICSTAFAASGIGYLASTFSSAKNASVNAIIATFLCAVFSGVEPTLRQVEKYTVLSYPWYLSFATWTSEATYVTWVRYINDFGYVTAPIQEGANVYGYDVSHGLSRSIGALVALGIAFRVLVLIIIQRY